MIRANITLVFGKEYSYKSEYSLVFKNKTSQSY